MIPGSVLIMDVSNSSACPNQDWLRRRLQQTVSWIDTVSGLPELSHRRIAAVHRAGDEVFVAAEGCDTAYLLSFWIHLLWNDKRYPFYSAMSVGNLGVPVPPAKELETWNSPLAKSARMASNRQQHTPCNKRPWLVFAAAAKVASAARGTARPSDPAVGSAVVPTAVTPATGRMTWTARLNEYVLFQHRFLRRQTAAQRQAGTLDLLNFSRTDAAHLLQKDISTISRQVQQSNMDLIRVAHNRIVELLMALQGGPRDDVGQGLTKHLRQTVHLWLHGTSVETDNWPTLSAAPDGVGR